LSIQIIINHHHLKQLVLVCLFLVCLFLAKAQCLFTIGGKVLDADTKEALADATIVVAETKQQITSNAKGEFLVQGLCPGKYELEITHIGCEPYHLHVHISNADWKGTVELPHHVNSLEDVTVTSNTNKSIPSAVALKSRDVAATRGLSLAEALKKIAGVSVLQTGTNIYKPVIQGLHSSRVLVLNNGIRQEGQQWGSEHAPEIDPYIANRLSVVKGAGALRYGGDAIGGLVLVEARLLPSNQEVSGEINTAFFSNNNMGVLSGMVEANSKKNKAFAWRLQGTVKKGGYARTADYWLRNSGTEEFNFSAAAGWRNAAKGIELFYSQFNTNLGIFSGSHIGNTTDLINAINQGQPPTYIRNSGFSYDIDRPYQSVQHQLFKLKAFHGMGNWGRMNYVVSGQFNQRKEFDVKRFASSSDEPQLDLQIGTMQAEAILDHFAWHNLRGSFGASVTYQKNIYNYRLFIPNYEALNIGLFGVERWEMGNINVEAGLRFDTRNMYSINTNVGNSFANKQFNTLTGSLGLQWKAGKEWLLGLHFSSATRAPQVNELFVNGLHHGAARIETGDQNLRPEQANSLNLQINFSNHDWVLELGGFFKDISDFIYLEPTYPPQLTIRGAFPAFVYRQTKAQLYGADFDLTHHFSHHLSWQSKIALLYAWNQTKKEWLINMPANRYETALSFSFIDGKKIKNSYVKLGVTHVEEQTRVPQTGSIEKTLPNGSIAMVSDYAPPPAAYTLLDAEGGLGFNIRKQPIQLVCTVSNLMNAAYRDYLNAFRYFSDDMGRNIALKIKLPINTN
jgi:iron complex outermembrane recepter protein